MAMHLQQEVTDDFVLGPVLGRGNFATVYKAYNKKTNEIVAIKQLNKLRLLWGSLRNPRFNSTAEVDMMKNLHHPNIIRLHSIYETTKEINLVLELAEGGNLLKKVQEFGPYSEENAKTVIRTVLNAVRYLHAQNLVHRDLKSENVVLVSSNSLVNVKITDFGFSKLGSVAMKSFVGTPQYLAPEILKGTGYGKEVDIWAIGIIAYQILSDELPFKGQSSNDLYNEIQTSEISFPEQKWKHISESAKDFIKQMLDREPKNRLTASQAFEHDWLSSSEYDVVNYSSPIVTYVRRSFSYFDDDTFALSSASSFTSTYRDNRASINSSTQSISSSDSIF